MLEHIIQAAIILFFFVILFNFVKFRKAEEERLRKLEHNIQNQIPKSKIITIHTKKGS